MQKNHCLDCFAKINDVYHQFASLIAGKFSRLFQAVFSMHPYWLREILLNHWLKNIKYHLYLFLLIYLLHHNLEQLHQLVQAINHRLYSLIEEALKYWRSRNFRMTIDLVQIIVDLLDLALKLV